MKLFFFSIGTKRMPIALSDSDDDCSPPTAKVPCINSKEDSIKSKVFEIPKEMLNDIDDDIIEDLKSQTFQSLCITLATRTQKLRNLKNKIYICFQSLLNNFSTPVNGEEIDDKVIETILEEIMQVNLEN